MRIYNFIKIYIKIRLKIYGRFHIFTILDSPKPRAMKNDIWQAHLRELVGVNLCTKKNKQTIPHGLRIMTIFSIFWVFPNPFCAKVLSSWRVIFIDNVVMKYEQVIHPFSCFQRKGDTFSEEGVKMVSTSY